jgi:hypothetical protein
MAQSFYGSICIEDLFAAQEFITGKDGKKYVCLDTLKGQISASEKNGKHYANIGVWVNDEADQYGNIASMSLSQSKEDREAKLKKTYIGNLKASKAQSAAPQGAALAPNVMTATNVILEGDLPF